jgi:hypothetical protein
MRLQRKSSKQPSKPIESQPQTAKLCNACLLIFSEWEQSWANQRPPNDVSAPHLCFEQLVASSVTCQMCSILLRRDFKPDVDDGKSLRDRHFVHITLIEPGAFMVQITTPWMLPSEKVQFTRTLFGQIIHSESRALTTFYQQLTV